MMDREPVRYRTLIADSDRWRRLEHRAGDIVISTPPKAGTTLTQMLCALLIFGDPPFPASIDSLSPWLDMLTRSEADVLSSLDAQQHRRFIKTHTPLDGLPLRDDVVYLVVARDPRDVMVSWEHHEANIDLGLLLSARADAVGLDDLAGVEIPPPPDPDLAVRFSVFIDDERLDSHAPSLASVLHHYDTGWQRRHQLNVHLLHYGDLRHDLVTQMAMLADALGVEVTTDRLAELASHASIDAMRERASEFGPEMDRNIYTDQRRFFRTGGVGEWRTFTTPELDARYERRVADLVAPDLAAWVHRR
jgi:hypothetical protein